MVRVYRSTKTKLKSEVNKFLILFSKKLTGESDRKILPTTIESFTNEFLKHSETDLPKKRSFKRMTYDCL